MRRVGPEATGCQDEPYLFSTALAYIDGLIDLPSSVHRLTLVAIRAQMKQGLVLLVEEEQILVGYVFLTCGLQVLCLDKLAIATARQRWGIGRRLFEASAEIALAEGFFGIELQARVELIETHAAFTAIGIRKVG